MIPDDVVARAFELAKGGTCQTVSEIGLKLAQEGYSGVSAHLSGPSLKKQLIALMRSAS